MAVSGLGAELQIPATLPGWKMELVAEAPKIKHPSVVCAAPDGRVFVAEDPMDISTPRADAKEGRIVCFHADGRVTVFAEQLFAVFGMQYLEGKLYVLHNPKFSVFTDDNGVGKDRLDLIETTNPKPWALDWNDHVPANFRLGMDGYFYVAVGDKGIYGAVGRDGKRVDLHGGGILRLRTDGTGLEIFCTGVRNILDVAMNEEDEFFTYDNTDEQQWMGRLTHMVDGGFYGYPYDFIPQRPYTLWMMADYGGGAATGTLCYNEDALPREYHGNLFLADFGKRQVMRVRVEHDGGTYRAVEKIELFPDPPPEFRPVGIAWSADGQSMFICDWQHRDVKEKVVVGRFWKLTFAGESLAAPKPKWFLPTAMGRQFEASTDELIEALAHPSHSVRLTAQRRLADRLKFRSSTRDEPLNSSDPTNPVSSAAIERLIALLTNRAALARARWHALWALDGLDAGLAARKAIIALVNDTDPSVRRQAIRQLGTRRVSEATDALVSRLQDSDASVRFHAATALGRIGNAKAIPALVSALREKDVFGRYAVFTALNRLGRHDPTNWASIVKGLEDSDAAMREGTVFTMRETYDATLVKELSRVVRDRNKPLGAREAVLALLTALHHQKPPWRGEWWAYHPVNSPPPAKTVEWEGTRTVLAVLRDMLTDSAAAIRRASVMGVREARDSTTAASLREMFHREPDHETKRQILATLGSFRDMEARELTLSVLREPKANAELLASAVTAAGQIGGEEVTARLIGLLGDAAVDAKDRRGVMSALAQLKATNAVTQIAAQARTEDAAHREAALDALVRIGGHDGLSGVMPLLNDASLEIRRNAVLAAGRFKNKMAMPALLQAFTASATRAEAVAALALMPDVRALDAYLDGLGGRNANLRESCRKAMAAIQQAALPLIETRAENLAPDVIAELRSIYAKNTEARKGKLFTIEAKVLEPSDYERFGLSARGEAARGRIVFTNASGVACLNCHTVGREGGTIGPDLSNVGGQFGRAALIESILYPSKVIREGYQQTIVETEDDEITGLFKGETSEELHLLDAQGKLQRIPKPRIRNRRMSQLSMMPEGLQVALTLEEFGDLIAYLESLKSQAGRASATE